MASNNRRNPKQINTSKSTRAPRQGARKDLSQNGAKGNSNNPTAAAESFIRSGRSTKGPSLKGNK